MGKLPIPDDWDGQSYRLMVVCIPDSINWRAICRGKIYELTRGRFWDEKTGSILGVQAIAREIYESVDMNCMQDILNELKRSNAMWEGAAIDLLDSDGQVIESLDFTNSGNPTLFTKALQSLDTKTAQFISWQEMLDDLGNTLGVTHGVYLLFKAVADLFPTISLKADATKLIQSVFEYLTWRAPLKAMLGSMVTIHSGMLATMATEKLLSFVKTIVGTMSYITQVADGWRQAIFGNWSITDMIFDVWDWFISDGDGGSGGPDPDNDPDKRIEYQFYGDLIAKLEDMRVMLETRSIAETTAGNTRTEDIETILNAIENVLGGDYEPS